MWFNHDRAFWNFISTCVLISPQTVFFFYLRLVMKFLIWEILVRIFFSIVLLHSSAGYRNRYWPVFITFLTSFVDKGRFSPLRSDVSFHHRRVRSFVRNESCTVVANVKQAIYKVWFLGENWIGFYPLLKCLCLWEL